MADGLTFINLCYNLSDRVGAYNYSVASDLVKLKRFINLAQSEICSVYNWPFLMAQELIQTSADITTGTATINSGSTSLTLSSAPTSSVTDYFIQFSSDSNWYRVTDHTAASTSATITPAYAPSANLVAGTYKLRKLWYSTSTPLDTIVDMKNSTDGTFIPAASPREADINLPLYYDQGSVERYIASVPSTSGGLRFSFLYSPDSKINIIVRGIKTVTELSADSDVSVIPGRWTSTLLELSAYYAFTSLNDSRAVTAYQKAYQNIEQMQKTYAYDIGRKYITRSLTDGITEGPEYTEPQMLGTGL